MKKLLPILFLPAAVACSGDNLAPLMSPLTDQHAVVDVELVMSIRGTDPEGDALEFTFSSDDPTIDERVHLNQDGDEAVFRWKPLASDVGSHDFEISLSDGESTVSSTLTIDVALGDGGTVPVFVQPLGTGTTMDVTRDECVSFPIAVEDSDTPEVAIEMTEALLGASLQPMGAREAAFRWCPSDEQIAADDRYTVTFRADDGVSAPVTMDYLIVIQGGLDESCAGASPSVDHLPKNELSNDAHVVLAHISDDKGLKHEPLLYYAFEDPGDEPDLGAMTQLTMSLVDGDDGDGEWSASIPNPVAGSAPGTTQMTYYVIVAQDADAQGCSHFTSAPAVGAYRMEFEKPDDAPPPPMCTDDVAEEDDSAAEARLVDLDAGTFTSNDNAMCSLDDDWFEVLMYAGETLHATLTFAQQSADQDIDIMVYQAGQNLSGCSESEPWLCDAYNGQSADSDETLSWPITTTGVYHLVVRGWDGSTNDDYDICVGLSSTDCP